MSAPQTVYVTIGNSDDKLTQQQWAFFCAEVNQRVRTLALEVYGAWYSLPNADFRNACWGMLLDEESFIKLQQDLALSCRAWEQESIAFAVARVKFISGKEQS
jgi:hypothetical protein